MAGHKSLILPAFFLVGLGIAGLRLHAQASAGPRSPIDARIIEEASGDSAMNDRRAQHPGAQVPNGKGYLDAFRRLGRAIKANECIANLTIHGHGRPGVISMRRGSTRPVWNTYKRGDIINGKDWEKGWKAELLKLKGKLCGKGEASQVVITLMGCSIGARKEGALKVHEMAKVFAGHPIRVCVRARTGRTSTTTTGSGRAAIYHDWFDPGSRWQVSYSDSATPPPAVPGPTDPGRKDSK